MRIEEILLHLDLDDINQLFLICFSLKLFTELSFLYQKYIDFCRSNGMHPANNITFNERIRKLFYVQTGSTNNATWVFCDKPKEKDIPVSDDTQSPKSYVERFIDNLNEEK